MNRVIFSDIDGTIFSDGLDSISAENVRAINGAKKEKVEFVVNTANGYFSYVKNVVKMFDLKYAICGSGTQIIDIKNEKFLVSIKLRVSDVEDLMRILDSKGIPYIAYNEKAIFSNKKNEPKMIEFIRKYFDHSMPIEEYNLSEDLSKIMLISSRDGEVSDYLKYIPKGNYEISQNNPSIVEISPYGVNKGYGIVELAKILNVDLSKCMAIGDGLQDISMFGVVGFPYSMDNATAEVKAHAKLHAADVNQNGLSYAIDDYMYRTKEVENGK